MREYVAQSCLYSAHTKFWILCMHREGKSMFLMSVVVLCFETIHKK